MTGVTVILLALVTIPYITAESQAGEAYEFGGFLLNPQDGNSYLAKMYEGWRGEWLFTLPYTAEKGRGVFIYFYYILLGHMARGLGISLILAYHLARTLSTLVMSLAMYWFFKAYLPSGNTIRLAFFLASFGSGMGWLTLPFGAVTSDFWVAEAYPFLSAYVNAHFPLSLALLLYLLLPVETNERDRLRRILQPASILVASLALAILSPFAIAIGLVCWSGMALWELLQARFRHYPARFQVYLHRLAWIALGGLPVVAYEYIALSSDPLLSGWSAQNQTPAPPLWDVIISLSPLILVVLSGIRKVFNGDDGRCRLLVLWCIASLVLLYIPWSLQRRFMMGIYIPVAALATLVLVLRIKEERRFLFWGVILFILALPTNLLLLETARHGIQTKDARLYLSKDEAAAMDWVEENTTPDALIIASPETGLLIPARTGRRVIYGHPYETVQAEMQKERVERFFRGIPSPDTDALLEIADYIYYGPHEREIGRNALLDTLSVAYKNPGVLIYVTTR